MGAQSFVVPPWAMRMPRCVVVVVPGLHVSSSTHSAVRKGLIMAFFSTRFAVDYVLL